MRVIVGVVMVIMLIAPAISVQARHAYRPTALVGEVRAIRVGLGVQRPGDQLRPGRIQQSLYAQYRVATNRGQQGSLAFRDRSVLHVNQQSDLTLRSPNLTYVRQGQVDQIVAPGTTHRVETASAIASAIGSDFFVDVASDTTLVATFEGSVLVFNSHGYVYVKTGQATRVSKDKPPQQPFSYDVSGALAWRTPLTRGDPPLDMNLALDANGGHLIEASSEQPGSRSERPGLASYAIDGRLDRGWSTLAGHPTNAWLKIGFATTEMYRVSAVAISTSPFERHPPQQALRQFAIRASTGGTAESDFRPVYSGTVKEEVGLQRFNLPAPILARYIELSITSNYGDAHQTVVTELAVAGHVSPNGVTESSDTCAFVHPCVQTLLNLLNADRASYHVKALQLSEALSIGNSTCVGAYGHSVAMAKTNSLWHSTPKDARASYPQDVCGRFQEDSEALALTPPGDELMSMTAVNKLWMDEPHDGNSCSKEPINHACIIINPAWTHVGLGLYFDEHGTWVTGIFVH